MLVLIPLLPLVGFLINATIGKRLSKTISGGVACLVMIAAFAVSAMAVWQAHAAADRAIQQTVFNWIASGDFQIPFALRVDPLASLMILVITGIGSLIHIYSTAYMHEETDGEFARYFSYLNLFASFMLVLVLGSSFLVMFVGWEGVGLCSYLLIGFWYKKQTAIDAGKKAFVVNRIGDFGFVLGMLLLFVLFQTLDFQDIAFQVSSRARELAMGPLTIATLLLFLGATGKSAQIPLYVWLPDAMEGPTPVSALIHAATMVTAGVYMIGRNAVLFQHAPITMAIVAGIGVATALMAGTIGLVQNDIKRVLAYSTVSQLGYMFLAMGVGAFGAGIFHLYTHAFFKALLFLGSGAVIHALSGEQDMRNMGGLWKALPITYWTFLIGALAISGIPPLAGFFSKDEILLRTYAGGYTLMWTVGMITAFLTATYMFRLVFMTFHGDRHRDAHASDHGSHASDHGPRTTDHGHSAHLHDAPPAMAFALVVLAAGSILAGFVGVPQAIYGQGSRIQRFLDRSFEAPATAPATPGFQVIEGRAGTRVEVGAADSVPEPPEVSKRTEQGLMAVSVLTALAGIFVAMFFWLRNRTAAAKVARSVAPLYTLLLNKYYVDEVYNAVIVQPIKQLSTLILWRGVDVGLIDGAVNGVGRLVRGSSTSLRRLQTGSIRAYAASLFVGVVLILGWYLMR
jgi:NADH-quinone oxidoreductase subunit L